MYFILPFAEIIFDSARYQRFALLIQNEKYLKALVKRIDELDEEINCERRAEARLRRIRRRNKFKQIMKNIFGKHKS
jgi:hypothetical protein